MSSPRNDPQETILVVDDEDEIVQFVQDALEDEGYAVWTAFDGATAVNSILTMISPILRNRTPYQERGDTFFDELERQAAEKRLVRQLTCFGSQVELQPLAQAGNSRPGQSLEDFFRRGEISKE